MMKGNFPRSSSDGTANKKISADTFANAEMKGIHLGILFSYKFFALSHDAPLNYKFAIPLLQKDFVK